MAQGRDRKAGTASSFAIVYCDLNCPAQLSLNLDKLLVLRFIAQGSGSMIRASSVGQKTLIRKKLKIKVQVCTHLEREVPGPGLGEEAVSLTEALHDQALDIVHLEKE